VHSVLFVQNKTYRISLQWAILVGLLALGFVSCKTQNQPTQRTERRTDPNLDPGWPKGNAFYQQVCYQAVKAKIPVVPDAEMVNDDEICASCHEAYSKAFANNVHRGGKCESCHGPASRHVDTRGKEPGLIFSFKTSDPFVRAEACLKCHEQNACTPGSLWRTSAHAHNRVTCTDCHRGHYDVPPGTPGYTAPSDTASHRVANPQVALVGYQDAEKPGEAAGAAVADGKQPSLSGTSHNLGAVSPGICYKCHGDMQELQRIAGPHQICGPNGFNCTTCHDPHGKIKEESRKDLCLSCHSGAPTMAWHSSTHNINGVACTDCHNPHPKTNVPQVVNITHANVTRPNRLAMNVQQPQACYKCHPKIFGLTALPSHHPIQEGKMVCSDCHDAHGQTADNIKEASINLLCYKCHAEKQGPFAIEHPPVRENCAICHEPHGAVANNLLRQPTTFLCLRCHPGHNGRHPHSNDAGNDIPLLVGGDNGIRAPLYTNCTECHAQVHGSDRFSQRGDGLFTR
jgi:DmsE family decaheme c-type cytochrome